MEAIVDQMKEEIEESHHKISKLEHILREKDEVIYQAEKQVSKNKILVFVSYPFSQKYQVI